MLVLAAVGFTLVAVLVAFAVTDGAEARAEVRGSLRLLGVPEEDRKSSLLAPLAGRTLTPVLRGVILIGRRFTPVGYLDTTRRKLVAAGRSRPEDVDRYMVFRVLSIVAIPILIVLLLGVLDLTGRTALAAVVFVVLGCGVGPDASLNRQVAERANEIKLRLPDVLDLLTISVEAGLGFEQALDRTTAAVPGPLSDEFIRMLGEVRAGARRSDAMKAMEERIDLPELRAFVLAVLQADTFGVSIGRVMRAQAEEARVKRRQLAEEKAQKAPVKMLIPMVFCIFPALFVVILGPAGIQISRAF
jgi:tight adherence protein C